MNNGKEKNKENTKEEYKVNYFFDENSKININEIIKKKMKIFIILLIMEKNIIKIKNQWMMRILYGQMKNQKKHMLHH